MAINRSSIGQQIMKPPMKKKVVKKAKGGALSYISPAYALFGPSEGGLKKLYSKFSPMAIAMGMGDKKKKAGSDTNQDFNTSDMGTKGLSVRSIKKGGLVKGPRGVGKALRGYGKAMKKGK